MVGGFNLIPLCMKWWLLKTTAAAQLFMFICQKSRSKLSIELQTNITTDDPEAPFVWGDRLECDFIGKSVLDPHSKVTPANADLELFFALAHSWVATGVRDDDANFPWFCFSGKRPCSAQQYPCACHYVCNLKMISRQVQTWWRPFELCGCGVCCSLALCSEAVRDHLGTSDRAKSQGSSNCFMPSSEPAMTRFLPLRSLKAHPHWSADTINC